MKTFILIGGLLLLYSCERNNSKNIPIVSVNTDVDYKFEAEVKNLKEEFSKVNVDEVNENLSKVEQVQFSNRVDELRRNINSLAISLKSEYSDDEKKEIKDKLSRTKTMWEYLLNNYSI